MLALKLKPIIAAEAKKKQAEYHGNQYDSGFPKNSWEVQTKSALTPVTQPTIEDSKPQGTEGSLANQRNKNRQNETNYQVAQKAGVSEDTIRKVEKIEAQATPEIKAALRGGKMLINVDNCGSLPLFLLVDCE